jgi:uncharacterized protein (TIGR03503 family)
MLLLLSDSGFVWSQESKEMMQSDMAQSKDSPVESLGSEYENSILLLRNRFRIDYEVDEVTLVFFRKYGSSPVVLVRPDGSKVFQTQADGENIAWFDSETYDMINIKNPVPGPWQAVGQILPGSRVMVLSDIALHAEELPPIIFSGEILKQTAMLTNGGERIDYGQFRDVVELTIELASTNNPNYDNFGAKAQEIARFEDDGRGMDERPLDGEFTGQFNLSIAPGEWRPIFRVSTPMFTREQVDPPIQLYPTPINISVELNGGGDKYHKLIIDTIRELVDINSLLIDGKIRFPNGDIQNFSLTDPSDQVREHMIVAFEDGVFRVKLTAYGKTVNGRDFILDVPEYSFLAKSQEPEPEIDPLAATDAEQSAQIDTETGEDMLNDGAMTQDSEEEEPESALAMILYVNGGLLFVGILVIAVIVIKRNGAPSWMSKLKFSLPTKSKSPEAD